MQMTLTRETGRTAEAERPDAGQNQGMLKQTHRMGAQCPGDDESPELPMAFRMLCGEVLTEDELEGCAEEWQQPTSTECREREREEKSGHQYQHR